MVLVAQGVLPVHSDIPALWPSAASCWVFHVPTATGFSETSLDWDIENPARYSASSWNVWGSCGCYLCHGEVTDECVVWSSINGILAMVYRFRICVDWWWLVTIPRKSLHYSMAHLGFAKERIFTKHSLKRSCHQSCASFSSNLLGSSPTSGRIWQNQSLGTYQPHMCETKFTLCPKKMAAIDYLSMLVIIGVQVCSSQVAWHRLPQLHLAKSWSSFSDKSGWPWSCLLGAYQIFGPSSSHWAGLRQPHE